MSHEGCPIERRQIKARPTKYVFARELALCEPSRRPRAALHLCWRANDSKTARKQIARPMGDLSRERTISPPGSQDASSPGLWNARSSPLPLELFQVRLQVTFTRQRTSRPVEVARRRRQTLDIRRACLLALLAGKREDRLGSVSLLSVGWKWTAR